MDLILRHGVFLIKIIQMEIMLGGLEMLVLIRELMPGSAYRFQKHLYQQVFL